jgi:hypothetical protein
VVNRERLGSNPTTGFVGGNPRRNTGYGSKGDVGRELARCRWCIVARELPGTSGARAEDGAATTKRCW